MEKNKKQSTKTDILDQISSLEEKTKKDKVLVEAALYVAGRPLDLKELCSVLSTRSKKKTKKILKMLIKEYRSKRTALEIIELKDDRYVLQLKAEFTPLVKKLVNRPLLSSGPLKTLSYIAFRQPVLQKRVIDVRGQHAYGHVKTLREMGLIIAERSGRSIALRTTDYFADYFGLTLETASMKRELRRIFGSVLKEENQQ